MRIILAILLVALYGCAVSSEGWDQAVKMCENNNGIQFVFPDMFHTNSGDVICKNGMKGRFHVKKGGE